jgi:hypothetical protein
MGVELVRPPEQTDVAEPAAAADAKSPTGAGVSRAAALLRHAAAPRAGISNRQLARQPAPVFLPGPDAPSQAPAGPQRGANPAEGMAAITRRFLGSRPGSEAALRRAGNEWAAAAVALIQTSAAASGAPHAQAIAENEASEIPGAVAQLLTDYFGPGAARDRDSVRQCYEAFVRLATSKAQEVRLQFHHNVIVETHSRGGFGTGNSIDDLTMLDTALTGMPDQHVWGQTARPLRFRRQMAGAGSASGETDPPTSTITLYDSGMQAAPYGRSAATGLPGYQQTIRHEVGHMVETALTADVRRELFTDILGWEQYSWAWISARNSPHAPWQAERAKLRTETGIADDALDAWLAGFTIRAAPNLRRSDTQTRGSRSYVRSATQGDFLHSIKTSEMPQGVEFDYALTAHNDYLAELYTFAVSRPGWLAGRISEAQKGWWRRRVFGTPATDQEIMRAVGMEPNAQTRFIAMAPGLFTWPQINDAVAAAARYNVA